MIRYCENVVRLFLFVYPSFLLSSRKRYILLVEKKMVGVGIILAQNITKYTGMVNTFIIKYSVLQG